MVCGQGEMMTLGSVTATASDRLPLSCLWMAVFVTGEQVRLGLSVGQPASRGGPEAFPMLEAV